MTQEDLLQSLKDTPDFVLSDLAEIKIPLAEKLELLGELINQETIQVSEWCQTYHRKGD